MKKRTAALAAGERTGTLEPTDKFCSEIEHLAGQLERIGKQAAGPKSESKPEGKPESKA